MDIKKLFFLLLMISVASASNVSIHENSEEKQAQKKGLNLEEVQINPSLNNLFQYLYEKGSKEDKRKTSLALCLIANDYPLEDSSQVRPALLRLAKALDENLDDTTDVITKTTATLENYKKGGKNSDAFQKIFISISHVFANVLNDELTNENMCIKIKDHYPDWDHDKNDLKSLKLDLLFECEPEHKLLENIFDAVFKKNNTLRENNLQLKNEKALFLCVNQNLQNKHGNLQKENSALKK